MRRAAPFVLSSAIALAAWVPAGCATPELDLVQLPLVTPDDDAVQGVVDELSDIISRRYRGRLRPSLFLSRPVNLTPREVDVDAFQSELARRMDEFNVCHLVLPTPEEPSFRPATQLVARVSLADERVNGEPRTTKFSLDVMVAEGGTNLLVAICRGTWKEKLPGAPAE